MTAREWLISGGGGFEDGEAGIRACTMSAEHAIELMDEYAEYRLTPVLAEALSANRRASSSEGRIAELEAQILNEQRESSATRRAYLHEKANRQQAEATAARRLELLKLRPIEEAPRTGEHILAYWISPTGVGFGTCGGKQQEACAVVHWWDENEAGWYLSLGSTGFALVDSLRHITGARRLKMERPDPRKQFEDWLVRTRRDGGYGLTRTRATRKHENGIYVFTPLEAMWQAWKASRATSLEEGK